MQAKGESLGEKLQKTIRNKENARASQQKYYVLQDWKHQRDLC